MAELDPRCAKKRAERALEFLATLRKTKFTNQDLSQSLAFVDELAAIVLNLADRGRPDPGIDALIAAAKEIDRMAKAQKERTSRLSELARLAKTVEPRSAEHQRIIRESLDLGTTVVDFSTPINEICRVLKQLRTGTASDAGK